MTARKATPMNDTLADALQKIAAGGMTGSPATPPQPPAAPQTTPLACQPAHTLLPRPQAAPLPEPPLIEPAPALPSGFAAFQAIVICPPEPAEVAVADRCTNAVPSLGSNNSPPPVSPPLTQESAAPAAASGVPPAQERRFKVPARLRSMAASTAQTAAGLQNSATTLDSGSWNDRLRTAAALLLSVGMAWVVWTDLRQPAAAVADNAEDSVDVDQLLREFETADQHSHKHDQQIQRMLAEPDLKSAPPVMTLDEELAAPGLATGELPAGKLQRTAATTEVPDHAPVFSSPAAESDESAAAAVYPDQQPARPTRKAGSGRPLRFTGQIQPMNQPAIAN